MKSSFRQLYGWFLLWNICVTDDIFRVFVFNDLRNEVVGCFVDVGGIVDDNCKNILFIIDMAFDFLGVFSLHVLNGII